MLLDEGRVCDMGTLLDVVLVSDKGVSSVVGLV